MGIIAIFLLQLGLNVGHGASGWHSSFTSEGAHVRQDIDAKQSGECSEHNDGYCNTIHYVGERLDGWNHKEKPHQDSDDNCEEQKID
jgi:hypothetical protein